MSTICWKKKKKSFTLQETRACVQKKSDLKNEMSFPCFLRTGFVGRLSLDVADAANEVDNRDDLCCCCWCAVELWWAASGGGVPGKGKWAGTLSPMILTHSQGKKPTSKPRLPRHQILSSGGGISMTDIMSPTCINNNNKPINQHIQPINQHCWKRTQHEKRNNNDKIAHKQPSLSRARPFFLHLSWQFLVETFFLVLFSFFGVQIRKKKKKKKRTHDKRQTTTRSPATTRARVPPTSSERSKTASPRESRQTCWPHIFKRRKSLCAAARCNPKRHVNAHTHTNLLRAPKMYRYIYIFFFFARLSRSPIKIKLYVNKLGKRGNTLRRPVRFFLIASFSLRGHYPTFSASSSYFSRSYLRFFFFFFFFFSCTTRRWRRLSKVRIISEWNVPRNWSRRRRRQHICVWRTQQPRRACWSRRPRRRKVAAGRGAVHDYPPRANLILAHN